MGSGRKNAQSTRQDELRGRLPREKTWHGRSTSTRQTHIARQKMFPGMNKIMKAGYRTLPGR